ncbi:MAG: hypothetical protein KKA32_04625 [Actinobacteria bacterium]|nr:hypothetical protein [Actinomycetota bacterium]
MALTLRQRTLLHIIVQRFDRSTNSTVLDPVSLGAELSAGGADLAADLVELEQQGYAARVTDPMAADAQPADPAANCPPIEEERWVVTPTDRGVMAAMGLD